MGWTPPPFQGTLPPGVRDRGLAGCEGLPPGPRERCIARLSPRGTGGGGGPEEPVYGDGRDDGPSGPGPGGFGDLDFSIAPYTGPLRPRYNIGPAPRFSFREFDAPTTDSIYADPSYQFRLGQSVDALESSAAARGVLRSGGTLSDITERAGEFASQEYANIYERALRDYQADFNTAYAAFQPRFNEWSTLAGAEIGAGNLAFQAALDRYFFGIQQELANKALASGLEDWDWF